MTPVSVDRVETVDELWAEYKTLGDRATRDRLILHYSPLVKFVAGRVLSRLPDTLDGADLVSYGILGLIDAIEKFDPERGFKFETYAVPRIRGAILDELRSIDWVPRSVRAKARAADQAYTKLEHKLQRSPTDEELAIELGISQQELDALLRQTTRASVLQLDEVLFTGGRGFVPSVTRLPTTTTARVPASSCKKPAVSSPAPSPAWPIASAPSSPSTTTSASTCPRSGRFSG